MLDSKSAKVKNNAGKSSRTLFEGGKFSNFRSHTQGELQGEDSISVKI